MRVLGRIRLSRFSDESTSLERQREIIQRWADDHGHEVVGWAEDVEVSGSVDPFKTPELGPWLTTEKQYEWDILVAWKLDRLGRNAIMLNKLFGFCLDNAKTVVSCSESIDLGTPVGRLIANVIAFLAEGELETIKERTQASRKKLVQLGRWTGGRPTYGYRAVKLDTGGWVLEPDPESSAVLHRIVDQILSGDSALSVANQLNHEGVKTPAEFVRYRNGKPPRGGQWKSGSLIEMLRSQTLVGYILHNGVVIRDDKGEPVLAGPPLIPYEKFARLQLVLDTNSRAQRTDRIDASPMLGVAVCYDCGNNLYHQRQTDRGVEYRYYKCTNRCTQVIDAETVETLVRDTFLEELGDVVRQERVYIPAESHQIELEQASSALDELMTLLQTVTSNSGKHRLALQIEAIDARISALEMLPESSARIELRPTKETYREAWEHADTTGRRELLVRSGITGRFKISGRPRGGRSPGAFYFDLVIPDDIRERMAA